MQKKKKKVRRKQRKREKRRKNSALSLVMVKKQVLRQLAADPLMDSWRDWRLAFVAVGISSFNGRVVNRISLVGWVRKISGFGAVCRLLRLLWFLGGFVGSKSVLRWISIGSAAALPMEKGVFCKMIFSERKY